ncbi:hypothetical protein SUGI_0079380 [Cryptomeria japonica]|nr:hypothetical protein SUGI_0079380 [Cryptomeria japonica]
MAAVGKQDVMGQSNCNGALVSLSPCLHFIAGNGTIPSQGCCGSLAFVVKNNAPCLCQLLTRNNSLGIPINQTRALALPAQCKVTTPPVSRCQNSEAPVASPSSTGSGIPSSQATPGSDPLETSSGFGSISSSVINLLLGIVLNMYMFKALSNSLR